MGAKGCIGGGVILIILGIAIVLIGTVGIPYELPVRKHDYLVIDSPNSQQYKDWAGGYDKKTNYQMVFYFFNLTNPDDVRQNAAKPNYTTVGPYIYRRYRQSKNVTFPDGGNQISFTDYREYVYDSSASDSKSNMDTIINVNPVYFSALAQAGNEQNMLVACTGGFLSNFSEYFSGPFISVYTSLMIPSFLPAQIDAQVRAINDSFQNGTQAAREYFLSVFCNATSLNDTGPGNYTGLLLSQYFGEQTNITLSSATALLDPDTPYSLLDYSNTTAWTWDRALANESYSLALQHAFGLTARQVEAIWHWRVSYFGPFFIYPAVISKYDLDTIEDIGWLQWLWGHDILGGTADAPLSIFDCFPVIEIGYYFQVELFVNPTFPSPFSDWRAAKGLFSPTTGLRNVTLFQAFALTAAAGASDFTPWGLTNDQAQQLYGYSVIMGGSQVPSALMAQYGASGGLILTQPVNDWVFNCDTFLMDLLLPVTLPCSILINQTIYSMPTIYSGKNNITMINQYIELNGQSVITGIWNGTIPVKGNTELGQFIPDQTKDTALETFNVEFSRTMSLQYYQKSKVADIDTNQFMVDYNKTFLIDPQFYQTIPGFANLTSVKNAPVYYSLWDMFLVSEDYRTKVIGLNDTTTILDDNTVIDVEPITGNTLRSRKRLQANVFAPPNCTWCVAPNGYSPFDNNKFPDNTFYPYVKAGEFVEISGDLASSIRLQIRALKYGPRYGLIIGLAVGLVFCFIGLVMIIYGRRRARDYISLNDRFSPS